MTRKVARGSVALAVVAAAIAGTGAVAGAAGENSSRGLQERQPVRFTQSDVFIEINATDGDAGLQMNLAGDAWRSFTLRDPRGRSLLDIRAQGRMSGYGLTDVNFESAEPPFERVPYREFRRRFPEGRYGFSGTSVSGRRILGSDRLSHEVPARPQVTSPPRGATVDPANLVVRWDPVSRPHGIRIVGYQVIVTAESDERDVEIDLGPGATSATIPADFLERGAGYALEVIAVARDGNRTITDLPFTTSR